MEYQFKYQYRDNKGCIFSSDVYYSNGKVRLYCIGCHKNKDFLLISDTTEKTK